MNAAEQMLKFLQEDNILEAEKQLQKVKRNGTDEEKFWLAEELTKYGYLREAKDLYESLLNMYPEESELTLRLAELSIELNEDEQAYAYLETIKPDDPNYAAALLVEADLYQMQGLYEVSEHKLLHAKELLPKEPVIDFALGELYMTQGRFLEASRYYTSLIDKNEYEFAGMNVYARMAEALSAGGAFEDALPFYQKALDHKLDVDTLFGYGLTAFQVGQYPLAIQALKQLRELDQNYLSLYLYLAKSFEHEERLDEALEAAQAGIELDEFNKDLIFYAGKISLKLGDEGKAEHYFRHALALDPEFIEAATTLNKLFLHQERYEDVLEIAEQFIQGGGVDPQFYWDSAISFQYTENYKEALKQYELAYNDFKNNQDFLKDYGYFLLEEGKKAEAIKLFKRLAKKEPTNEEWLSILERLDEE
ncbi:tetratricopeptide repeat protein [Lederbergia sp. NSJ-179]|uniref:tetratricopeptide repeat protein n=1 Tax=Lederbergia sp. NSJ-179 TaxID=2931402 RepID=UPI001FD60E88|nr:tetratricopeptide repeat protein [Lederbergia sp. NSJ-179]MCJ7839464.1 tetratricopeptide repeat protein [Lederbergia sp. NSJ-179]